MARNRVQFQKGYSLTQFMDEYGTEEKCREALFRWRWPNGFVCPRCSQTVHCRVQSRALYQCSGCRHQVSLTAGTILASTKLALRTWFLAMYLMTQTKNGISALELSRQLAVSYNTAWKVKHKLMQVMKERDDTRPLGGWVQLDDAYWGGVELMVDAGLGWYSRTTYLAPGLAAANSRLCVINTKAQSGLAAPSSSHRSVMIKGGVEFRLVDDENAVFARDQGLSHQVKDRSLAVAHVRRRIGSGVVRNADGDVVAANVQSSMRQEAIPDLRQLLELGQLAVPAGPARRRLWLSSAVFACSAKRACTR